ncbi:MAG: alpha/beta hydrolase [Deltaproteobacteria bacterium]|nr:MAG: alpha/beta hydrolase [Deltaproteobacteria bacterium]
MARAKANGIELTYDTFGDPRHPAILLIGGVGTQMIFWEPAFCEALAAGRYRVIRFDNRDTGESTKFDEAGIPDLSILLEAYPREAEVSVPYTLDDMADDAAGLLDALGIERAHIVGLSMGGMIAQCFVLRHPRRARSLVSIMSTTGSRALPPGKPEAVEGLFRPMPTEREAYIEESLAVLRSFAGGGFPFDEEYHRRRAAAAYDRAFYPPGFVRQFAAILAAPDRSKRLEKISTPTLVIHGDVDPLIPVEHGIATARVIPKARLRIIEGLGHELPPPVWEKVIGAMHAFFAQSDSAEETAQ